MTLEMKLHEREYIGMQKGLEQGLEKGMKQGIKSHAESMALKMLRKNKPIDEISDFTELSSKDIERLKASL